MRTSRGREISSAPTYADTVELYSPNISLRKCLTITAETFAPCNSTTTKTSSAKRPRETDLRDQSKRPERQHQQLQRVSTQSGCPPRTIPSASPASTTTCHSSTLRSKILLPSSPALMASRAFTPFEHYSIRRTDGPRSTPCRDVPLQRL